MLPLVYFSRKYTESIGDFSFTNQKATARRYLTKAWPEIPIKNARIIIGTVSKRNFKFLTYLYIVT